MIRLADIDPKIIENHKLYAELVYERELNQKKGDKRFNIDYKFLENELKEVVDKECGNFLQMLLKDIKNIVSLKPAEMDTFNKSIEKDYPNIFRFFQTGNGNKYNLKQYSLTKKIVKTVFNYDKFIQASTTISQEQKWGAYTLVKELDVNICPYCQRSFVHTYYSDEGKVRPTLDHFLDKDKHPYFAISIYNLIPSCYNCNSSFKKSLPFKTTTHLHPYVEGAEDAVFFKLNPKRKCSTKECTCEECYQLTDLLVGDYDVVMEFDNAADSVLLEKIKRNIEVFKLDKLYGYHTYYIDEILRQSQIYTEEHIKQLGQLEMFNGDPDVREILLGFKSEGTSYQYKIHNNEQVLAKLLYDIRKDLGLMSSPLFR